MNQMTVRKIKGSFHDHQKRLEVIEQQIKKFEALLNIQSEMNKSTDYKIACIKMIADHWAEKTHKLMSSRSCDNSPELDDNGFVDKPQK